MLRAPYRWLYFYNGKLRSSFFKNISFMWSDLKNGVRNVIRWVPVIWHDVDWDESGLLQIMEKKLRWMEKSSRKWGRGPATTKKIRVCAELLKRINEDDYFTRAGYDPKTWDSVPEYQKTQIAQRSTKQPSWDLEYFSKIFSRNVLAWWD